MMLVCKQVCGVNQERRDSTEESFLGGGDTAAAGDHQPERGIELLLSWMLRVRQCEAGHTERESQPGEGKQTKFRVRAVHLSLLREEVNSAYVMSWE